MALLHPDLLYGYIPTEWICALFISLFSLATLIHVAEAVYFRLWWLFPTVILGGLGEIIGWSGRLWSSKTFLGSALNPYLMQISSTIIAPTPILAANFVILGYIIGQLGIQYSRLSPRWYTIIFCSADVIALVVQAVGGASASEAASSATGDPTAGGNIMLAGIVVQLVSVCIYSCFAAEFLFRYHKDRPVRQQNAQAERGLLDARVNCMILGLSISTLCIFIRAIYRTIELADGWSGTVIRTQVYFNVFDGGMICISIYAINIFHPGFMMRGETGKLTVRNRFDSRGNTPPAVSTGSVDMKETNVQRRD